MGGCSSKSEEEKVSEAIGRTLKKDHDVLKQRIVLLLLGSPESGIELLLKKIRLYQIAFLTDEEREGYKEKIRDLVLQGVRDLVQTCSDLNIPIEPRHAALVEEIKSSHSFLDDEKRRSASSSMFSDDTMLKIKRLWEDSGILQACKSRPEFESSHLDYFLYDIFRLGRDDYEVADTDILKIEENNTRGVPELDFGEQVRIYKVVDGSRQRGDRKKWLHHFQDCLGIVFCASLSEFDEFTIAVPDDPSTASSSPTFLNCMSETLNYFEEIANVTWFKSTSIILLLSKKDSFEEKLRTHGVSHLQKLFPEFVGQTSEEAYSFVRDKFLSKSRTGKDIYTHVIDENSTLQAILFDPVVNCLLGSTIGDAGF